jgi:hypothetical protein
MIDDTGASSIILHPARRGGAEGQYLSNNVAITTDEGRTTKDEARCNRSVFRLSSFVEDRKALI